jgi:Na+/proline symporter
MNQVNRVYTIMLIVLAIFLLLSVGQMMFLPRMVAYSSSGKLVLNYIKVIFSIYFCATVLTLILRAKRPAAGRVAATALNLALLAIIPFGTVVGIFGLSKLDKE